MADNKIIIVDTNNNKENNMNNVPFTKCHAITKAGSSCCSQSSKFTMPVLVKGIECVWAEAVNTNNFPGWLFFELTFCTTHVKMLKGGKAIKVQSIKSKKATKVEKKGVLCGNCHEHHDTSVQVKNCYRGVVRIPIVSRGVQCGNCRKNGVENPYHATPADVKACYTA